MTGVRCVVGVMDGFKVEVGLYQESALSPFLFANVMNRLIDKVRQESLWTLVFKDENLVCLGIRLNSLERWMYALEKRDMKVSRNKTDEFKCLRSTFQSKRECTRECRQGEVGGEVCQE